MNNDILDRQGVLRLEQGVMFEDWELGERFYGDAYFFPYPDVPLTALFPDDKVLYDSIDLVLYNYDVDGRIILYALNKRDILVCKRVITEPVINESIHLETDEELENIQYDLSQIFKEVI